MLENGLRVVSQKKFGQFCTVGVAINSGSRYEVTFPSGISHFLEKLAFCSTNQYNGRDEILQELEKYGGICDCQGSRDTLIYASSIDTRGLEAVTNVLSEVILHPKITDQEVDVTRQTIRFELEDHDRKPDQDSLLQEAIHKAAYGSNTLGLPKLCPEGNIDLIDRKVIYDYLKLYHTPDRMVFAGVGVDHDHLVETARKYFLKNEPVYGKTDKHTQPDNSIAQYQGGLVGIEKDLSGVSIGTSPIPELVHLSIGLESSSFMNLDDFIPTCVLNMLMGGGGSFSAGGPGKGMYTRLYTNVLNRYHWMYSAQAFNHAYADSGVFCINASCHPSQLRDLVNVIVKELFDMSSDIGLVELNRAKKQLQSMLLMNLEARPVVFEDVARQVLGAGFRRSPKFFIKEIERVTVDDIRRVVGYMLRSKPSVAAIGDIKQLPPLEDFATALNSKDGRIPRRFTLFH